MLNSMKVTDLEIVRILLRMNFEILGMSLRMTYFRVCYSKWICKTEKMRGASCLLPLLQKINTREYTTQTKLRRQSNSSHNTDE